MRAGGVVVAALFLAALTLRPQIVGVGPIVPEIQDDLDTRHAVVGLLGTIPVLCMGVVAPQATRLARRIGTRSAMTLSLALLGGFGLARAVVPGAWGVVLLTWGVGIGMGIGNALAPLVVKERLADRPATGTGVYTAGIQIGASLSAAIAVPLAAAFGGWRATLAAFSLFTLAVVVAWYRLTRGEPPHRRPVVAAPRLPWHSRTAWLLVAMFSLMACSYYGLTAWLPDAYSERGWSDGAAGVLLAVMNLTAIPASFVIPWLSDRRGGRRPYLVAMSVAYVVGATGLVLAPGAAYAFGLLTGVAQGGMFALVMTIPLDLEQRPERVGALVGMMLGVGYTIGAASPFLLGGVRDVTGSFDAVLWVVVGFLVVLVAAAVALQRPAARAAA